MQTHVVRTVFLVLCLSMLTLQNGCSNSGSGQSEAPASNANAVSLALSTTSGFTAVVADGRSTLPIRIRVTNGSGAGMAGVAVTFATTAGELSESPVVGVSRNFLSAGRADQTATARAVDSSGRVTVTTDTTGVAQVLLTASITVGTAVVTADALNFRTHIDILFVPGPAARVQLNASPNAVNASGTAMLTATVTDANGNLVPGETVTFTLPTNTSGASLSTTSGTTDNNGQMTVQYTAGTTGGADTVRAQATSTSVAGSTSITVTAPPVTPPSSGPSTPVPSRIDLLVSSPQLSSNGTGSVTLTTLVRDAANNVVSGALVRFSADSGGIQVTNGTTGATGTATALLTTGGDQRNRTINVTAMVGNISSRNTVQITGTTLSISGANSIVLGVSTRLSILLRDSGGTGIANQSITVSSALGNPLSATTVMTDFTGQTTVDVTGLTPGNDTIQVSGLGATATTTLLISAANFLFTAPAPATQVRLNTPQAVTVHWDQAGVPQGSQLINFFATRGNFVATPISPCPPSPVQVQTPTISVQTNAQGNATVGICADNSGPAIISAAANVSSGPSSQVGIEFIATTVASLILQASPTTLGVNVSGGTTQQSIITAVLRDSQGNLVQNKTVSFAVQDVSGGRIAPPAAVTDSFGRASTVYVAGAVPSAQDGVLITATADGVQNRVTLTVTQQPLFVVLGTGNQLAAPTTTQYSQPYSVLVNDANGNPVAGATVELNVIPIRYEKGLYVLSFNSVNRTCVGWVKFRTVQGNLNPDDADHACDNEDINLNGILNPGEDRNNNGRVDPGNIAAAPRTVITDTTGFALFDVLYAKEFTWVEVELEARVFVAGSEGLSRARFFLNGIVSDFNNCTVAPPGAISPYGMATTCSCDEQTNPICPAGLAPVVISMLNPIQPLPSGGGSFTFTVTGGTQSGYDLSTSIRASANSPSPLSTTRIVFGETFGLQVPANATGAPVTITINATDLTNGQVGTLTLIQSP